MRYYALSQHGNARFPDNLTDVRGFEVRTRDDDDKLGRVNDVIVGEDGSIRYLDVDAGGFFSSKHVLLPIGASQIDERNDVIWVSGTKEQLKNLPEYAGDVASITDDSETRFRGAYAGRMQDDDLYDQGRFFEGRGVDARSAREARLILSEEQLDIGKRQVQAGEVGVRKTVETERVRETVPLVHEEVTIERHPVSADTAANVEIGEDEIRVPVMREEIVAQKRVVPVEEVVLRKHAVTEERVVEDEVRRERLDVDDRSRGLLADDATVRDRTTDRAVDRDVDTDLGDRAARGARNVGNRIANAADDVKDRIDGNPASRPGPDATDADRRF